MTGQTVRLSRIEKEKKNNNKTSIDTFRPQIESLKVRNPSEVFKKEAMMK